MQASIDCETNVYGCCLLCIQRYRVVMVHVAILALIVDDVTILLLMVDKTWPRRGINSIVFLAEYDRLLPLFIVEGG